MSEVDLSAITPPVQTPSEVPDEKTKAEQQQLARRPATPLEREASAHHAHIDALHARIDVYCGEVGILKEEVREARNETKQLQVTMGQRDVRIKELEVSIAYGGCLNLVGLCRNSCRVDLGEEASTLREEPVEGSRLVTQRGITLSGPIPHSQPSFPSEFLIESRLLSSRRTAPAHLRQRANLVLLLHYQPSLTNVAAGAEVGLHANSVRLWRQRWAKGLFVLDDQPGRGRRPTFSPSGPGDCHGLGLRTHRPD